MVCDWNEVIDTMLIVSEDALSFDPAILDGFCRALDFVENTEN